MSLIHEALKRAEEDKLRNSSPYFNNLTVLPPAQDEVTPPPRPPHPPLPPRFGGDFHSHRQRPPFPLMTVSGALLVLAAVAGGGYFWYTGRGQAGPESAEAAPTRAVARSVADHTETGGDSAAVPIAGGPADGEPPREPGKISRGAKRAFGGVLTAMRTLVPSTSASDTHEKGGNEDVAPTLDDQAAAGLPSQTSPPARAAASPHRPVPVNTGRFRLSAIMRGPNGNAALINGQLYHEGQTVAGARIVTIGRYHVELEVAGQRFTIRM